MHAPQRSTRWHAPYGLELAVFLQAEEKQWVFCIFFPRHCVGKSLGGLHPPMGFLLQAGDTFVERCHGVSV